MPREPSGVPSDVVDAALEMITARWHRRGVNPYLRSLEQPGLGTETYWVGGPPSSGGLPEAIAEMLDRQYRVPTADMGGMMADLRHQIIAECVGCGARRLDRRLAPRHHHRRQRRSDQGALWRRHFKTPAAAAGRASCRSLATPRCLAAAIARHRRSVEYVQHLAQLRQHSRPPECHEQFLLQWPRHRTACRTRHRLRSRRHDNPSRQPPYNSQSDRYAGGLRCGSRGRQRRHTRCGDADRDDRQRHDVPVHRGHSIRWHIDRRAGAGSDGARRLHDQPDQPVGRAGDEQRWRPTDGCTVHSVMGALAAILRRRASIRSSRQIR